MPSDLDTAVRWSKKLEALLKDRYGATGRGLHEKIDSVEKELPRQAVRDLRLVATVRNRIVHEEGYDRIERKSEFLQACRHADAALGGRKRIGPLAWVVVVVLLAGVGALILLVKSRNGAP